MFFVWVMGAIRAEQLAMEKFDGGKLSFAGLDSRKLLDHGPEAMALGKAGDKDSDAVLSYNVFSVPDEPERKKDRDHDRARKAKKPKAQRKKSSKDRKKSPDEIIAPLPADIGRESAMMATQSTYHPPLANFLLKKPDEDRDAKRDAAELARNMDEISALMAQATMLVARNREIAAAAASRGGKKKDSPRPRDLLDYKVVEVEDERK